MRRGDKLALIIPANYVIKYDTRKRIPQLDDYVYKVDHPINRIIGVVPKDGLRREIEDNRLYLASLQSQPTADVSLLLQCCRERDSVPLLQGEDATHVNTPRVLRRFITATVFEMTRK
jgi:hypothetical protein